MSNIISPVERVEVTTHSNEWLLLQKNSDEISVLRQTEYCLIVENGDRFTLLISTLWIIHLQLLEQKWKLLRNLSRMRPPMQRRPWQGSSRIETSKLSSIRANSPVKFNVQSSSESSVHQSADGTASICALEWICSGADCEASSYPEHLRNIAICWKAPMKHI